MTADDVWFPLAGVVDVGFADAVFVQPWVTLGLPVFGTGSATFDDGTEVRDRLLNWHATVSLGISLEVAGPAPAATMQ